VKELVVDEEFVDFAEIYNDQRDVRLLFVVVVVVMVVVA